MKEWNDTVYDHLPKFLSDKVTCGLMRWWNDCIFCSIKFIFHFSNSFFFKHMWILSRKFFSPFSIYFNIGTSFIKKPIFNKSVSRLTTIQTNSEQDILIYISPINFLFIKHKDCFDCSIPVIFFNIYSIQRIVISSNSFCFELAFCLTHYNLRFIQYISCDRRNVFRISTQTNPRSLTNI